VCGDCKAVALEFERGKAMSYLSSAMEEVAR
jgi:hypothetical protein